MVGFMVTAVSPIIISGFLGFALVQKCNLFHLIR